MSEPTLREAAQALLPCPFCGGGAQTLKHDSDYWVECDGCRIATLQFTSESAAAANWNRRASPAAPVAVEPVAYYVERNNGKPVATAVWMAGMPEPDWDLEMMDLTYPQFAPHRRVALVPESQLHQAVERAREEGREQGRTEEREACRAACEAIADEYQRREGHKYPELKSDAQTGAEDCEHAISKRGNTHGL